MLEWGSSVSTFDPPYDVILAADVVYIEDAFAKLSQTLEDLSDTSTIIFLCCKHRYKREDTFFKMLTDSGKFTDNVIASWPVDIKLHKLKRTGVPPVNNS